MSESKDEFKLQIFDGKGYDKWRYRLLLFLDMKECVEVILKETRPAEITETHWKRKEIKAKNYLVNSVTNTQLELIISASTARDMVKKLDETYLVKNITMKLLCKRKLLDLKMKDTESPMDFFNDFEKLVNELKNAGENVTEEDKLNYLLLAIPESQSHIVDIVDALPTDENKIEYVKTKLTLKYQKKGGNERDTEANRTFQAFQTHTRGRYSGANRTFQSSQSYNGRNKWTRPGSTGNNTYKQDNQGRGRVQERNNYERQPRCFKCNRIGHIQQYCRSGNYYTREKNGTQMVADVSKMEKPEEEYTFSVEVMTVDAKDWSNWDKTLTWLLDSGCSHHIVNSDKYFASCENIENPINVKVGDGHSLHSNKKGNILIMFNIDGKCNIIDVKDVYYVPSMRHNLLSVSNITD